MLDRERKRSDRVVVPPSGAGVENRAVDPADAADDRTSVRSDRKTIVPKPLDELDGDVTVQRSPLVSGELGGFELDEPDIDDRDELDRDLPAHDVHDPDSEDPDLDDPELETRVINEDLDITREHDARALAAQIRDESNSTYADSDDTRDLEEPDPDEPTLIGFQGSGQQSAGQQSTGQQSAGTAGSARPFKTLDSRLPIGVNRPPAVAPASVQPPPASTIRPPSIQATPSAPSVRSPSSIQPPPASAVRAPTTVRPPPLSSSSVRPPSTRPPTSTFPPPQQAAAGRHDSQTSQAAHLELDRGRSDKWYLRVQLNAECVADLWVRDLTPHNVLVWSEDMQTWVPLLTVRELRDAIREAHDTKTKDEVRDSNFVFLANPPSAPNAPPRVPASMTAAAAPQPSSRWALPKPRTISNVPPPLLTASTPILASANQSLILPLPKAANQPSVFSVPPVVRAPEARPEFISEVEIIPEIPKPARLPSPESVQPTPRLAAAAPPPRTSSTRPPPPPSSFLRRGGLYAALPLMHVERVVWLAAGVAVASAVALLVRGGEPSAKEGSALTGEAVKPQAALGAPTDAAKAASAKPTGSPNKEDVHRLEDLPVVGKTESAAVAPSFEASAGRSVTRSGRRGAVQPANISLASTPSLTPASGQSSGQNSGQGAGSFDTAAARRILTSAAARASRCASEGSASGSVVVTFAPSGFVQSATMAGLKGQGTNVGCVLRAFQEARVTPFSGGAVTVRKGFQIP